jgi:hypothetical protein
MHNPIIVVIIIVAIVELICWVQDKFFLKNK